MTGSTSDAIAYDLEWEIVERMAAAIARCEPSRASHVGLAVRDAERAAAACAMASTVNRVD